MDVAGRAGLPWVWGATAQEVSAGYACDGFADDGSVRVIRAVTARAPASECFVWLCQLRRAPYSYDLLDNFGRRSPRQADHALTRLRPGLDFMKIFTLVEFVPGRSLTVRMKPGPPTQTFGRIAVTYELAEQGEHTRLIGVMAVPPAGRRLPALRRVLLVWGDLIMIRKQLTTLAGLAERDARRARANGDGTG